QLAFAEIQLQQGKYRAAEQGFAKTIQLLEAAGDDELGVATTRMRLAYAIQSQGRFSEAETISRSCLAVLEKAYGQSHPDVGSAVYALAGNFLMQGRLVEAESLYQRALKIQLGVYGPKNITTAWTQHEMGLCHLYRGKFAEAESLCQISIKTAEELFGTSHSTRAYFLASLGDIYVEQNRVDQARDVYQRALKIQEDLLGMSHPDIAWTLTALASAHVELQEYAEASKLLDRALRINQELDNEDGIEVGWQRFQQGRMYVKQQRWDEASASLSEALNIYRPKFGDQHPDVASTMLLQGEVAWNRGDRRTAESLLDQVIAILDRAGAYPSDRFQAYLLRAKIGWDAQRRSEALADLRMAMSLAEEQRANSAGTERERAKLFVNYAEAYEQMVAWQLEQGDVAEALSAMERARARSMIDELSVSGASLQVGRSAVEREALQRREAELTARVAELEKQLQVLVRGKEESAAPGARDRLENEVAQARKALYDHYRDMRGNNPVYRNLLSAGSSTPRLSQIQRELVGTNNMALIYFVGQSATYLAVLSDSEARLVILEVDQKTADALGIAPGPLTYEALNKVFLGDRGVLGKLASPQSVDQAIPTLAQLWRLLIPEAERKQLTSGDVGRLIVMPDGPLAMLPFEALVVERGDAPTYLLDAGPPVHYGPSATVMLNLRQRAGNASNSEAPVLSVGDPNYPRSGEPSSESTNEGIDSGTRYASLGGQLPRLPFTAWESSWVNDVFAKRGFGVERLIGEQATEANVRTQSAGRRYLHLACHGLADHAHGNLFGSLALTPGAAASVPADDGFLTLAEIYELDLRSCELTILSACNTNYGPQQRGEGVWTLSRGFLVAGSRRVVASNWVVDDQAAASVISYFASGIANAEEKQQPVDYAQSLNAAKKWVRQQEKWSSPYYWATFVLVGPN
ncbi:MAG: CHAT domain-containing protein, partial [Planctomycetales bacterium]|nr:CHAT domain-containing protein [Planctomycetales bacterium]